MMSEWIDELAGSPDEGVTVRVRLSDGDMATGYTHLGDWINAETNIRFYRRDRYVIYWQPLPDQPEANAALIAAAPDMYEALEWAYRVLLLLYGDHGGPLGLGATMAAAMKKARGEAA